jgi:glycerol uptake facilitator-like aquaporin
MDLPLAWPGIPAAPAGKLRSIRSITEEADMQMSKRLTAEFIGTLWLVLDGCGSAVLAAAFTSLGIGFAGVSLAFGLTVLTMAYAIGLCLTLIHLISIPVTNTSVNPARSTGPALFVGGWATSQLWLFWIAPMVGAALAGMTYRWVGGDEPAAIAVTGKG